MSTLKRIVFWRQNVWYTGVCFGVGIILERLMERAL